MNTTHWTDAQRARLTACIDAGDTIAFWCSDAFGRPSNGGDITIPRAAPGVIHTASGQRLCEAGALHATREPHRWAGVRVWIVACRDLVGAQHDKLGCRERETLGEILPGEAIVASVAARLDPARACLDGAYLAGANLAGANLAGAYLARAYLARAYLDGAYLDGACLDGAKRPQNDIQGWTADEHGYLGRS